jgi:hypothetical protein
VYEHVYACTYLQLSEMYLRITPLKRVCASASVLINTHTYVCIFIYNTYAYAYICMYAEEDLLSLFEQIQQLNAGVEAREQLVLTPFFIVAGPDYERMRELGCPGSSTCRYSELGWHNSSGGIARHPYSRGDLRRAYRSGFEAGLWHPEYHGRSHFDVRAWEQYLREGDQVTAKYFDHGLTYYSYGKRRGPEGGYQSTHSEYVSDDAEFQRDAASMHAWVRHGINTFSAFWGYAPSVTACPCHYARREHGHVLAEYGVQAVQGEKSGRGMLDSLIGVERLMYDVWTKRKDEWEAEEDALWREVDGALRESDGVAIQVCLPAEMNALLSMALTHVYH